MGYHCCFNLETCADSLRMLLSNWGFLGYTGTTNAHFQIYTENHFVFSRVIESSPFLHVSRCGRYTLEVRRTNA